MPGESHMGNVGSRENNDEYTREHAVVAYGHDRLLGLSSHSGTGGHSRQLEASRVPGWQAHSKSGRLGLVLAGGYRVGALHPAQQGTGRPIPRETRWPGVHAHPGGGGHGLQFSLERPKCLR